MRWINCLVTVGLGLALGAGCRMCASTYDYANPLVSAPCQSPDPGGRAGSILSGTAVYEQPLEASPYAPETEYYEGAGPTLAPAGTVASKADSVTRRLLADEEIASGVVLDIQDRKVEPPSMTAPDEEQLAETKENSADRSDEDRPQAERVAQEQQPDLPAAAEQSALAGPAMTVPQGSLAPENTTASSDGWMPASAYRSAWRSEVLQR